jgi:chemotaxis signal transduction protein
VATTHAREIAAAGWVTPVPTAKAPVAGVTQLRGQILPVLDVNEPPREVQPEEPLLVVEYGPVRAAIVFDKLCANDEPAEVLDVGALFDKCRR